MIPSKTNLNNVFFRLLPVALRLTVDRKVEKDFDDDLVFYSIVGV